LYKICYNVGKGVIKIATDLEIRKEQRRVLFELMEIKRASKDDNDVLNGVLARQKSMMMEEDVALVEKMFYSIYPHAA